jgi:hypothetical protein
MARLTVPVSTTFRRLLNKILRHHLRNEPLTTLYGVGSAANEDGSVVLGRIRIDATVEDVRIFPAEDQEPEIIRITIPAVKED